MRNAVGTKYEATQDLSRVEIAKLIREDIKSAVKEGTLPKATYSVRVQSYAGGGSINVTFAKVEEKDFMLRNPVRIRWDMTGKGLCDAPEEAFSLYSERATEIMGVLEGIMNAYNYDHSDSQSDYFNVRFYGDAKPSWEWDRDLREAEMAKIKGETVSPLATEMPANDVDAVLAVCLAADLEQTSQADFLSFIGAS